MEEESLNVKLTLKGCKRTADATIAKGSFLSSAHTWLSGDRAANSGQENVSDKEADM